LTWAVSSLHGGASLGTIRLVAALSALLAVLGLYELGRRLAGETVGRVAAVVLLTTYGLVDYAHRGMFDTLLTACVVWSLVGYAAWRTTGRRRWTVLLIAGLAGGFMAKGPLAWLLPLLAMAWDMHQRRAWRGAWRTAAPLALAVLVLSGAWYAVVWWRLPEARPVFISALTVNFGVRTSTYEMAFHREPWYYYLWAAPVLLLPWSALLPWLAWQGWRRRAAPWSLPVGWALCWLGGGLLLLTLVPAKADRYVLPLAPAWALLLGVWLPDLVRRHAAAGWRLAVPLLGLLAGLLTIALPVWLGVRLGEPLWLSLGLGGVALAAGLVTVLARCPAVARVAVLAWTCLVLALVAGSYARWLPRHRELHADHHSAAYVAYRQREAHLRAWLQSPFTSAKEPARHE
jgi:4-amino-4-deoxy-L-arabinose transferase-like glycosyltransferase